MTIGQVLQHLTDQWQRKRERSRRGALYGLRGGNNTATEEAMPTGPQAPALPCSAGTADRQQLLPFMLEPAASAAEFPRLLADAGGRDPEPATGS